MAKKGRVRIKQVGGGGGNAAAAAAAAASLFQNPLEGLPPEQMMQWIQPKPDPSFQMIWPLAATFSMKFSNFSVIYPNYLDGTKTVKQGRRISKADAVSPCPALVDIQQALQILQLRHVVQPYKGYSRDAVSRWENPGRVLVDLESYQEQQTDQHATKKTLLRDLARCIVQLPSRLERLQKVEEQRKAMEAQQLQLQQQQALVQKKTASAAASDAATSNNKKKKGNNKKKK